MKRRYSPAARRAHLRAMHNRPSEVYIVEMDPKDPIAKLIESYEQGFLTAVELADLILETLPQPEPAPHCFVFDCPENAFYLTDGIAHCWRHRRRAELEAEADRQKAEQQPEPAPKPTPAADKPWWLHDISAEVDDAGEIHLTIDGQPAPKHDEGCQCHLCWAASLDMPSPPWDGPEGGAA